MIKENIRNAIGKNKKCMYASGGILNNYCTFKLFIPGFVIIFDGAEVETNSYPPPPPIPHKYYGTITISDFITIQEVEISWKTKITE